MLELRAVDEGAVPASAPATSRLFMLPVATRWWVSTDNSAAGAGPKRPGGLAHGMPQVMVKLTGSLDGREWRRRGGAARSSGGGRTETVTALHGEAQGRVRREIEGRQ